MSDPTALEPVAVALQRLTQVDAPARLRAKDAGLFTDDPDVQAKVAGRLGWLDASPHLDAWSAQITDLVTGAKRDGFRRVVLAGMGGSSLAPEVFAAVFDDAEGLVLEVLDSTHPDAVVAALDATDLTQTLVIVASKSGSTEETRNFGAHAATLLPDPSHLVAITDPGSALETQAQDEGWRAVLRNPADIGGRFSALSLFGMAPAALAGIPVGDVWASAKRLADTCASASDIADDPGAMLGAYMAGFATAGQDKLTLICHPTLEPLGDWIEQLVAESTGKKGAGIVPIVGEPLGTPQSYGPDRAFVELRLGGVGVDGIDSLRDAGFPVYTLNLPDRTDIGAAYLQWELATAYAGVLLGVNPFDEPNVTESKDATTAMLAAHTEGTPIPDPAGDDLGALLDQAQQGDYLSIQAYLPMTDDAKAVLAHIRVQIREVLQIPVTVGFGPRFLHSTGQLHKGAPDHVLAWQLTDQVSGGPAIPGRDYDFATLIKAQAAGDLDRLRAHNVRVATTTIEPADLGQLTQQVTDALGLSS